MSETIDVEAERVAFSIAREGVHYCDCMLEGWLARARLAAEREHTLLDLLADAQHAVCCYSCPEPREGEPERHCELCRKITEALKGPSDDTRRA